MLLEKGRFLPKKFVFIPRLELTAGKFSVKVASFHKKELDLSEIDQNPIFNVDNVDNYFIRILLKHREVCCYLVLIFCAVNTLSVMLLNQDVLVT